MWFRPCIAGQRRASSMYLSKMTDVGIGILTTFTIYCSSANRNCNTDLQPQCLCTNPQYTYTSCPLHDCTSKVLPRVLCTSAAIPSFAACPYQESLTRDAGPAIGRAWVLHRRSTRVLPVQASAPVPAKA